MGADTRTAGGLTGPALEVIRHHGDRFYELLADGQFAGLIVYEDARGRYVFTHAFIAEGYRGRGLSGDFMCGVLEDVRQRHITVTSYCPVLDRFIEKSPGYVPLIGSGNPGNSPKSGRNALGASPM